MTEPDFRPSADAAMDRYARGEDAAFAELYDLLGPRIEAFLMRRTRDRGQAEDLVQQTFLHIHRARQHFAPGAAVMPWAFAIARRLVIDKFRHTQRQPALVNLEEIAELPPGAFVPAPDELVGMRRLTQRVELELGELPESYRLVFELIQLDGLSMAEAAEVLGTSIPAVKMRAHRCTPQHWRACNANALFTAFRKRGAQEPCVGGCASGALCHSRPGHAGNARRGVASARVRGSVVLRTGRRASWCGARASGVRLFHVRVGARRVAFFVGNFDARAHAHGP